MKTTDPRIENRAERHYLGVRVQATIREMGTGTIPRAHGEAMAWLSQQGGKPDGPPFVRFHVIDMAGKMDIEMGWPVAAPLPGNGRVEPGVLPASRYATVVYTGIANGVAGNKVLLGWAREKGHEMDRTKVDGGDAFAARVESYLTDPADEADPSKWEVEVAIKLADE